VLRAEEVTIARDMAEGTPSSARNRLRGQLREVALLGALARITVEVEGTPLIATVTARSARELALAPGDSVVATIKATAVHLC